MRALVNDACISCGLCIDTCPTVFHMGEEGTAVGGTVSAAELQDVQLARDTCPVSAISIEE